MSVPHAPSQSITPAMGAERAAEIAQNLDLRQLPPDFLANPYPVYAWLREHAPDAHLDAVPDKLPDLLRIVGHERP